VKDAQPDGTMELTYRTTRTEQKSSSITSYLSSTQAVGYATWDSDRLDALLEFGPALQILIADLPAKPSKEPTVPEVIESKAVNYFLLSCYGRRELWKRKQTSRLIVEWLRS